MTNSLQSRDATAKVFALQRWLVDTLQEYADFNPDGQVGIEMAVKFADLAKATEAGKYTDDHANTESVESKLTNALLDKIEAALPREVYEEIDYEDIVATHPEIPLTLPDVYEAGHNFVIQQITAVLASLRSK